MTTTDRADIEQLAPARAAVYRFILAALDKPSPERHAWLRGDEFAADLARLCEQFDVAAPPESGELFAADYADHEAAYLRCFEVGLPVPPVVLLASHYDRKQPAPRIIHEHLLFYRRFGAVLAEGNIEPADHLHNELAFLIHLDELLAGADADRVSILSARRDFLSRHAARWPGAAVERAERKGDVPAVYRAILALLAAAVAQDLELTGNAAPAEPTEDQT